MFTDESKIDQNNSFKWNQLFQHFLIGGYKMLLQDYMCKDLRKDIYKNILKSGL